MTGIVIYFSKWLRQTSILDYNSPKPDCWTMLRNDNMMFAVSWKIRKVNTFHYKSMNKDKCQNEILV